MIYGVLAILLVVCILLVLYVLLSQLQVRAAKTALSAAMTRSNSLVSRQRSLAVAAHDGPRKLRERLVEIVRRDVDGIDAAMLLDVQGDRLRCAYAFGSRVERFVDVSFDVQAYPALAAALRVGEPQTIAAGGKMLHPADRAAIVAPLIIDGPERSLLYVASSHERVWSEAELQAVDEACQLAGPAYFLARDREQLTHELDVDWLTGCLRKEMFRQRLEEYVASHPTSSIAVIFIDADHFKRWNDTCGHASGDSLLRHLGRIYQSHLASPQDMACRDGGDEFAIALMNCDRKPAIRRAVEIAEAIRSADRTSIMPESVRSSGVDVGISGSLGVAMWPADGTTMAEVLDRADKAMYASKQSGRDRVSYVTGDARGIVGVSRHEEAELLGSTVRGTAPRIGRRVASDRRNLRVAGDD